VWPVPGSGYVSIPATSSEGEDIAPWLGIGKIWVASGGTFTLPAQLTSVAALNTIISWSPGETTKILHERPWIAVYGYGCIVRVGTDTQIADLLVEKGAHPLETCAPCHFCDPWPKLLKDQHEWGTILSLTLAHYRAFRPLPRPNHESFGPRSKVRFAVTSVN